MLKSFFSRPTRYVSLALSLSLITTNLRAQSDLDIIQAIAAKDLSRVQTYLNRPHKDLNRLYNGKTALMIAIETFEESLRASVKHKKETSVAGNTGQFLLGTGIFAAGLAGTGISSLLIVELGSELQPNTAAPPSSETESEEPNDQPPVQQSVFAWFRDGIQNFVGMATPTDDIVAPPPATQNHGASPSNSTTPLNTIIPPATLREIHYAIKDVRFVIKIISIAALIAAASAGVAAMSHGIPKALDGLFKTIAKPAQRISYNAELKKLKEIIYLLLRQEQVDVTIKNSRGETALDVIQRLMLDHVNVKLEYRQLAEVEQLLKVRQAVS